MKTLLLFVCILCCGVQIYSQYPQRYDLHSYNTAKSGNIQIVLYNPNPFLYKRDVTIAGIVTDTSTDNMSSITAILPSAVPLADFTEQILKMEYQISKNAERMSDSLQLRYDLNKAIKAAHKEEYNIFESLFKRAYEELSRRMDKIRSINAYKEHIKTDVHLLFECKNIIISTIISNDTLTGKYETITNNINDIILHSININSALDVHLTNHKIDNDTITVIGMEIQNLILRIILQGESEKYKDLIQFVKEVHKEIVTVSEKISELHGTIVKAIKEYQETYQKQAAQLRIDAVMINKMIKIQNPEMGSFIYTFETGNLDEIEVIVETSAKKDTIFSSSYGLVTHNYMPTRVEVYHILLTGRARISFNPQLYAGGIFTSSVYYRETYDQAMGAYRYARETHTAFEIGVMTNMNLMWRLSRCFGMGVGIGAGVNLPVSGHVPVNLRLGGSVSFLFGRYDRFSLNAYFLAGVIRRGIDRNIDEATDYTGPQAFSYVNGMGLGVGIGLGINIYKYRKNTELAKRTF